jgi:hypothetical protein
MPLEGQSLPPSSTSSKEEEKQKQKIKNYERWD